MDVQQRLFEIQCHLAIEILVLFFGHFLFGFSPKGALLVLGFIAVPQVDRETDVIGVLVDDLL